MSEKQCIIDELADLFNRWQALLTSLSEEQVHAPMDASGWTVKDIVAHLWSWQQASVARMEAALQNREPNYPQWWVRCGPDPEEDVDRTNAFLYEHNKDKSWKLVYADWKNQYMHYLELTRQIPEANFFQAGRYAWMGKYAIVDSTNGSLDHHKEHYETLTSYIHDLGA